jgi:hypothetical protein
MGDVLDCLTDSSDLEYGNICKALNDLCEINLISKATTTVTQYDEIWENIKTITNKLPNVKTIEHTYYIEIKHCNDEGRKELQKRSNYINDMQNKGYIKYKESEECDMYGLIPNFKEYIDKFKDNYIISYLIIQSYGENACHCNVLVYDPFQDRIERFEPNGLPSLLNDLFITYNFHTLDDMLFQEFGKNDIIYTRGKYSTLLYGPQSDDVLIGIRENEGYCVSWCIVYVFLRIAFPDYGLKKLIGCICDWNENNRVNKKYTVHDLNNFLHKLIDTK